MLSVANATYPGLIDLHVGDSRAVEAYLGEEKVWSRFNLAVSMNNSDESLIVNGVEKQPDDRLNNLAVYMINSRLKADYMFSGHPYVRVAAVPSPWEAPSADYLFYNSRTTLPSVKLVSQALVKGGKTKSMDSAFLNFCLSDQLNEIHGIDLSSVSLPGVTSMNYGLSGCYGDILESMVAPELPDLIDAEGMFRGQRCLKSIDFSRIVTSSIRSFNFWFAYCEVLQSLDLSTLDTSAAISCDNMFDSCQALVSFESMNPQFKNCTSAKQLFAGCSSLRSIIIPDWFSPDQTSFESEWMFSGCSALEYLDISSMPVIPAMSVKLGLTDCTNLRQIRCSQAMMDELTRDNSAHLPESMGPGVGEWILTDQKGSGSENR